MTPREIVYSAVHTIVEQPFTDETPLADLTDSLGLVEIGVEVETRAGCPLPEDAERAWRTVADIEKCVAALLCPRCGDALRERKSYCTDGTRRVESYCYGCENDDLIRLARSVGK